MLRTAGRVLCGLGGVAAWIYWLVAGSALGPQPAFFVWALAFVFCGVALVSRRPVLWRPDRWTAALFLIAAAAVIPRAIALERAPYGIALDEIIDPFLGLQVLRHHPWEIMSGVSAYFRTPYLTQVLQAWSCVLVAPLLGARLASLVIGIASLMATYALARRLFDRAAAFVSVVVLACSFWQIAYSRMGYPYVQPLFFVPMALYVLIAGFEDRNRFVQFLGGALLAACILVYTPARIAIPVFLAWLVHRVASRAIRLREAAAGLAVVVVAAAIILSPYLKHEGAVGLLQRYREATMGERGPIHLLQEDGWVTPAGRSLLASQLAEASGIYFAQGAEIALHDITPSPLVDCFSLGLGLVGLGLALLRPWDSGGCMLLVWIGLTFVFGQVLTDVATAAYRAGPLLPALAICAGLAGSAIGRFAEARIGQSGALRAAGLLVLIAIILPPNLSYLADYLARRSDDPVAAMARLIGRGSRQAVYYLTTSVESYADHQVFRFLADGRDVQDVPSLMDVLGRGVDERHDAYFVLGPDMAAAASVIRRCYPGTELSSETTPGGTPVLALGISAAALRAGHGCVVPSDGPGLRARYFEGPEWTGPVVRERLEDWPFPQRWKGDERDGFGSVEWSGFVRLPVSGSYRFQWLVSGGGVVGTRGEAVIGSRIHLEKQGDARARLTAGVYPVRLRCRPQSARAYCWLRWEPPGGFLQAVPPEFWLPPCRGEGNDACSP